jgi:hypothetical protein
MTDDASIARWLKRIGAPANGGLSPELRTLLRPDLTDYEILMHCTKVLDSDAMPHDFARALAELIKPTPGIVSPFSFRLDVERNTDASRGVPWRIVVKRPKTRRRK